MTIENVSRRTALFNGDGTTTVFHFAFKIFNANEADVVVTSALTGTHSLTYGVDFTVTMNADQDTNPGGFVTLSDPLALVFTLQIKSAVPYTQLVKLNNAGGFYPEVMNLAFDKLTMLVQQLLDTQQNPEVFGNLYTWTAYANSADGTVDFTNGAWAGHTHRGVAYNKLTAHESTDPADYVWEQIVFDGPPGVNGIKSVTLTAFKWSNSGVGSHAQAFIYTWATGAVSAYPAGWSAAAPASPDSGYTLHMIHVTLADDAEAVTSSGNWSTALESTIGYREDGSIGTNGQSYRRAYVVTTLATPPSITAGSGDVVPTNTPSGQVSGKGWSFNAYSSLAAGEFQYVTDGIYTPGGNIAWGNAYLNYLKVGSLSVLSADLGVVEISSGGSLASTGKAYGNSTPGFFMGYSGGAYKLDIGDSAKNLRWDGGNLTINGDIVETGNIKSHATSIVRTARNSAMYWQTFATANVFYTVTGSELTFPADANRGSNNIMLLSWWPENKPADEEWLVVVETSPDNSTWTADGGAWYFMTPKCTYGDQDLTAIWDFQTGIPTSLFYMRLKATNKSANNARIRGYSFSFLELKR